jgi:hypothetical protein
MVLRWSTVVSLGVLLALTSGCPEPDEDEAGAIDETGGETTAGTDEGDAGHRSPNDEGTDDGGDGDRGGGDGWVRPPVLDDEGGDDDGDVFDHPDRCWDATWSGDELPHVIHGNTIGRNDDFTGSCGIGAAPDYQLGFLAPWSGSFTFDTAGSSFDTVVYAFNDECGELELACNDDFIGLSSRITLTLAAGEYVTVTVDGAGPFEQGLFKLEVREAVFPVCETAFIPPNLPAELVGDTTTAASELASGCGGEGAPEQVYEFVAPGPGTFRFDTLGSSFDTVLYLLDECDGPPLVCNDDVGFNLHSELIVALAGGQQLLVVVDGFGPDDFGPFMLNVQQIG